MSELYNMKNPGVRRIFSEWKELQEDPPIEFRAFPTEEDIFLWHFMVTGPQDTAFEGGKYHGKILLPAEYPYKPPTLIFLTKNGRFETNTRICLSVTDYHPESWQPSWGIRTLLTALIGFFPTSGAGHAGAVESSDLLRKKYALESQKVECDPCTVFLADSNIDQAQAQAQDINQSEVDNQKTIDQAESGSICTDKLPPGSPVIDTQDRITQPESSSGSCDFKTSNSLNPGIPAQTHHITDSTVGAPIINQSSSAETRNTVLVTDHNSGTVRNLVEYYSINSSRINIDIMIALVSILLVYLISQQIF